METNKMLTKKEFKKSIIDGIKTGRLDPCNGKDFEVGEEGPANYNPEYYWCVEGNEVAAESPFYVDYKQSEFRFGISVVDVERYTEKEFGELSNDEIKQAMLDIIDEYSAVDDWYDAYLESLDMWG